MDAARVGARILRWAAGLIALVAIAAVCLLAGLWIERHTTLTLPAPTGSFAVGRLVEDWADPAAGREVLVWIWYPASRSSGDQADEYVPAYMRDAIAGRGLLPFLTRDRAKVHAHSLRGAPVSPQRPSYPVLLMRGGAAQPVVNYTTIAEDLASHGYVVAGIDAPYRTSVVAFPDGRVMHRTAANDGESCAGDAADGNCISPLLSAWLADMKFVLDRLSRLNASDPSGRFTGRLDLARVGAFGHSFGGAQAAQFCHDDARCKAAADVDGILFGSVVRDGARRPLMFVVSGQVEAGDAETRRIKAELQSVYDRLPEHERVAVEIRGGNHFLFSDDAALLKSRVLLWTLRTAGVFRIDGPRQLDATRQCLRAFFDAYLQGSLPPAAPAFSSALYPEITPIDFK